MDGIANPVQQRAHEIDYGITTKDNETNSLKKSLFELEQTAESFVKNELWNNNVRDMSEQELANANHTATRRIESHLKQQNKRDVKIESEWGQEFSCKDYAKFSLKENKIVSKNEFTAIDGTKLTNAEFILKNDKLQIVSGNITNPDNTTEIKTHIRNEPKIEEHKTFITKAVEKVKSFIGGIRNLVNKSANFVKSLFGVKTIKESNGIEAIQQNTKEQKPITNSTINLASLAPTKETETTHLSPTLQKEFGQPEIQFDASKVKTNEEFFEEIGNTGFFENEREKRKFIQNTRVLQKNYETPVTYRLITTEMTLVLKTPSGIVTNINQDGTVFLPGKSDPIWENKKRGLGFEQNIIVEVKTTNGMVRANYELLGRKEIVQKDRTTKIGVFTKLKGSVDGLLSKTSLGVEVGTKFQHKNRMYQTDMYAYLESDQSTVIKTRTIHPTGNCQTVIQKIKIEHTGKKLRKQGNAEHSMKTIHDVLKGQKKQMNQEEIKTVTMMLCDIAKQTGAELNHFKVQKFVENMPKQIEVMQNHNPGLTDSMIKKPEQYTPFQPIPMKNMMPLFAQDYRDRHEYAMNYTYERSS